MNFLYRHRVILGVLCLVLVVVFTFGVCFLALSRTTAQAQNLVIVIDPGHGGIDGGVVGIETGTKESDINLSLSRILQEQLEEVGFSSC